MGYRPLPRTTTKKTFVLIPLSRLAGVGSFCFNLFSPFWSYASSLLKPYCSKSFFTDSSHDFLGWPFFLFPVNSTYITSRIWKLMSPRMTWLLNRKWRWIIISWIFTTTSTQCHPVTKNITRHPINQSHPAHPDHATLHPTQPHLICSSEFPRFTAVQQNWSNATLINIAPLLQR